MRVTLERFAVTKRHALTISRGTSAGSENLLLTVEHEGITGQGEMAPTSGGKVVETAETAEAELRAFAPALADLSPWDMQRIEALPTTEHAGRAWYAALDIALHDWQGKRIGQPLWRMLGLDRSRIPLTSLTIGINPPEIIREIVPEVMARTGTRCLKVKLGNTAGVEADQEAFAAAQKAATGPVLWRVDANGGWSIEGALQMIPWLAERGVEYVEQPLLRGHEADLSAVHKGSPLPIYLDESIAIAADIPPLAAFMDGVNLKLMKCGGIWEALRIIHTARAHGLKLMVGCMSESSLSITAAAHLAPLLDAIDLDSHLNLRDDPFVGATLQEGRIVPNELPGLGILPRS